MSINSNYQAVDNDGAGKDITEYEKYLKAMSSAIAEKGRNYQIALVDLAIRENCIICLPTGCGKTYIALSVAKLEYLSKAIATKKKIIFLANSIPLVYQQAKYFERHISTSMCGEKSYTEKRYVKAITGDMGTDYWNKEKWEEVIDNVEILVMTPEILKIALNHNKLAFEQIVLLILDECHHCTKNHPMAVVMSNYVEQKEKHPNYPLPRIIGLTATIIMGTSKREMIPQEVQDIERRLLSHAVTYPEYAEVLRYATSASLSMVDYPDIARGTDLVKNTEKTIISTLELRIEEIKAKAKEISDSRVNTVRHINDRSLRHAGQMYNKNKMSANDIWKTLVEIKKIFENEECLKNNIPVPMGLGLYAGRLAAQLKMAFLEMMITPDDAIMDSLIAIAKETVAEVIAYCNSIMDDRTKSQQVEYFVSNKVSTLYTTLLEWKRVKGKTEELCGIVFCKERMTAQMLSWLFYDASKYCDKFKFIRPAFVVGSGGGSNDYDEHKINSAKQDETITKFHGKEVNLLFATNVIEEGIDVPACNVIIRFDHIDTYPSYVQSMGRARKKGAVFSVMTSRSNFQKSRIKMCAFQAYGSALAQHLIKNERSIIDEADVDDKKDEDKFVFKVNPSDPNSPKVTLTDSVQLVYQYCQYLSTDRIANLEPTSWWTEVGNCNNQRLYKAYVALPINSVVRDVIEGKEAENKSIAKRQAFFEACKRLYLAGALDEHLFPIRHDIEPEIKSFLNAMEGAETVRDGVHKLGTKNSTLWYPKKVPAVINKFRIASGDTFNAYWIQLTRVPSDFDTETDNYDHLYHFDKKHHAFAILTKLNLEEIPSLCLFGRHGVLSSRFIKIEIKGTTSLATAEILKIENFQEFIFKEYLSIKHPLMSASNEHSFLITAITLDENEKWTINWNLIDKTGMINEFNFRKRKGENERRSIRFSDKDLDDAILVPWYTPENEDLKLYCVCKTRADLSPSSPMDGKPNSKSFETHYLDNYDLKIVNGNQPFIQCAEIGAQLNFLTKKIDDTRKKNKLKLNVSGTVLVPEFVSLYPIPASILIHARFLPSIIHRTHRLLLSKEIHSSVAQTFNWEAALNWKAQDDNSFWKIINRDCPSPAKIPKMDLGESEIVKITQPKSKKSQLIKENNNSKKFSSSAVHLDYIHPDEITSEAIVQHRLWKLKDSHSESNIKSSSHIRSLVLAKSILPLVPINEISFESLDAATDFGKVAGPSPVTIMEALTLSNANDILSLENQEVMGDSFLKYCVSLHIFCEFPKYDEGQLTHLRSRLVSNLWLFNVGSVKNIGNILSGGIFLPKQTWLPPGVNVPSVASEAAQLCDKTFDVFTQTRCEIEKMSLEDLISWIKFNDSKQCVHANTTFTHSKIGDKSVADSVEALIGAYYMNGGQDAALALMDWIGLRGPDAHGNKVKYGRRTPPKNKLLYKESKTPESYLSMISDLENLIGYKFKNKWLLVEAFSHAAYINNTVTGSFQRLEFIGDAVLDFLVTNYIFKNCENKSPGALTDLRSALVNNITFGSLAVRYKLHNHLLLISKKHQDAIDKFEEYQMENGHAVTGHFTLLNDMESPIAVEVEVPKLLGDIFESLAGALFLDCNMSLDTTWKVFYRLMKNEIDEFTKNIPKSPVRELYEKFPLMIDFQVEKPDETSERKGITTVSVKINGKTYFGSGTNKKQAKQACAKYVLSRIKSADKRS